MDKDRQLLMTLFVDLVALIGGAILVTLQEYRWIGVAMLVVGAAGIFVIRYHIKKDKEALPPHNNLPEYPSKIEAAPPKKELTKKEKRAEWYNNMGLNIIMLFVICLFLFAVVAAVCAIISESIPGDLAENVLKIALYVVGVPAALFFIWAFLRGLFEK